jgi:hypothetical protein
MKVSTPTKVYNNGDKLTPPLPLKAELPSEEDETRLAKFKLRVTPANADSATYSFATRKLDGTEHLRYALNFYRDCKKILVGLHITDAAASIRVIRELLTGIGLSQFNTGIDDHVNEMFATNKQDAYDTSIANGDDEATAQAAKAAVRCPTPDLNSVKFGFECVIQYMSPHKVLAKQKRWMRRNMRKPADMSVREYANRLITINNDELTELPPFDGANQRLSDDEIIDILTSGIPKSWIREMDKQNFDPTEGTITEVLNFCERMESSEEGFEKVRNDQKTNGKGGKPKANGKPKSSSAGSKFCMLHGSNNTHDTEDCHIMKKTAESLKTGYKNKNDGQSKSGSKNQSWKRKADDGKKNTKNDLAAFVSKTIRKELHAFNKKRKVDTNDDKPTDDDQSVNNFELTDVDLSKMDFSKDSDIDDEFSV